MKTDNPVFVWMGKLGDLIGLNLLFLACCLPILTIGASATALFYTARKLLEGECVSLTKTFFHSFRQNWKQAMGVFLILLIVGALAAADLILGFRTPSASGNLFRGIGFGLGLVWLMVCVYIFALLSRYEYRTGALIYSASFVSILIMNGTGTITCDGETVDYRKGDSFFLPAGSGSYTVEGSCDALITTIREKPGMVRVGIDIGGRFTKVGLVDEQQRFAAYREIPFNGKSPEQAIRDAGNLVLTLLEENHIDLDLCANAGVGVAGIVEDGVVKYSNNLGWKNVPVAELLAQQLPIPIHVANNADCAVLGEMAAGAARGCEDVLLLTIGRGVGSGLVHNGQLYDGAEFGHMVIEDGGRVCSCGRRGCWEAYVSGTALRKETAEKLGRPMEWEELWKAASQGSDQAKELADSYIRRLGTGVVNLVNILHPKTVVIGGNLAAFGETWLEPLQHSVQSKSFGGENSAMPEIKAGILGRKAGTLGAANLV